VAGGTSAFTWAVIFGLYLWFFLWSVGMSLAMSLILGALTFAGSYFFVRSAGVQGNLPRSGRG
jgi:hypothetical protein